MINSFFTDNVQTSDITFSNCSFCNVHMYNNLIALLHLVYCIYMNRKARLLTVGFCDFLYLLFIYFLWYFFSKDTKFIVFVKSVLNLVLFLSLSFDLYYLWRTMHLIELCSNVYQNVNLVLSILPFFGG